MRLLELEVYDYRAFRTGRLRFAENGPVLIAGANNSGKTALLSAIDAVAGQGGEPESLRHLNGQERARIFATFGLDGHEIEYLWPASDSPRRAARIASGVGRRLQFVMFEKNGAMRVSTVHTFGPGGDAQPLATVGPNERGVNQAKIARAFLAGFEDQDERQFENVGPTLDPSIMLEDVWRNSVVTLADALQAWRARYYHFRALRQGTLRTQPLSSPTKLDPSGSNLAGVLHFLLTDRNKVFADLRALIAQIVPGIGDMQVRTGGDQMRIVFETPAGEINLKDLGTGVEQLLMTLTVGLTEDAPYTLIVEEPETNLHPTAQRALMGFLQEWATDRQIIAATHSPALLDWSPGGDRLWLVMREGGESRVEPVGEDPLALLRSLGVRPSDVLIADRLLIVEGPSDQDILEAWFPKLLRKPTVAILAGEGGDSAVHADRLAAWLTSADRTGIQQVLYMRDHDELAPEMLAKLIASSSVYVLRKRELENYLIDPSAIARVLGAISPALDPVPSEDEVAVALAEIADTLRRKIIVNRVCRRIQPAAPYMTHKLRQELAEAGADQERIISAVSERLMATDDVRAQVEAAWPEAEADVMEKAGGDLLAIAPGEELLDALFMRFAGRHYGKRTDGPLLARAMDPPAEISEILKKFMPA